MARSNKLKGNIYINKQGEYVFARPATLGEVAEIYSDASNEGYAWKKLIKSPTQLTDLPDCALKNTLIDLFGSDAALQEIGEAWTDKRYFEESHNLIPIN